MGLKIGRLGIGFSLVAGAGGGGGPVSAAVFGTDTAAGDGATTVSAPDGTYNSGTLSVTDNVMTYSGSGTLTPGDVTVGDTTVTLVSGKSVANATQFEAWLDETTSATPTLTYTNVVVSGDLANRAAGFSWNNRFKNLPADFVIRGAYPSGTAPTIDRLTIQTAGTVGARETVTRLKLQDLHFYDPIDLTRQDDTLSSNYEMLNFGPVDLQGLEIANCEFSSNILPRNEGGFFPDYYQNGIEPSGQVTGLWIHDCSFHNLVYPLRGSCNGALIEDNEVYDTAADFFNPEGGSTNWIIRNNDCRGLIGDGTVLHADFCQIQTQSGSDPVSGLWIYGNTATPGDFQTRAWPQAQGVSIPSESTTITDADATVTGTIKEQRYTFSSGMTANRTLTLPDAASRRGTSVRINNQDSTFTVTATPAGTDTIVDSGVVGTNTIKTYCSDGGTQWIIKEDEILTDADTSVADFIQRQRIRIDDLTADRTLSLPDCATNDGLRFSVTNRSASFNIVLSPAGSDTVEGGNNVTQGMVHFYSDGGTQWKRMASGFTTKEVPVTANKTLGSLYEEMLIGASAGVNVTLSSDVSHIIVRKHDNTAGDVTITAGGGQTIDGGSSITLTQPGAARELTLSGSNWGVNIDGVTMQGFFGNGHAEYNASTDTTRALVAASSFENFNVFANVLTLMSGNGIWIEQKTLAGGTYCWNTLGRVTPDDFDGDGSVTFGDGWLDGPVGRIRSGYHMTTFNNFTVGNLQEDRSADLTDTETTQITQRDNVALNLTTGDAATAPTQLNAYFNGATAADYQPTTRAETLTTWLKKSGGSMPADTGALGTTTANGIYDFDTKTLNSPAPAYTLVYPQRGALAVPLDARIKVETNIPIEATGAENIDLYNVTDAVSVTATFYVRENLIICIPASDLLDGKEYRITHNGTGLVNRFENASITIGNSSCDPVTITSGSASTLPAIGSTDWTFTASASAYENPIPQFDSGGNAVDPDFLLSTGVALTGNQRFDTTTTPYESGDLPSDFIVRAKVAGSGTATVEYAAEGSTVGEMVLTVDMSDGSVTSSDGTAVENTDFGTTAVSGGYEVWIKASGTSLTRYYFELNPGGEGGTDGLTWSEVCTIPANAPTAPFVAPAPTWEDVVGNVAPSISGVPTISGTTTEGETLAATAASVTGQPTPTRTWQWVNSASGDISGATSDTYVLQASDVGDTITVRQIETNTEGSDTATSAATATIAAAASSPTITEVTVFDNGATSGTTHTSGSFTLDGGKDVIVELFARNNSPTGANGVSPLTTITLGGTSIASHLVAQQGTDAVNDGGRGNVRAYYIPAASVTGGSQTLSMTFGNGHSNVRAVISEVTGGGGAGATDQEGNANNLVTSTVLSLTTTATDSVVRYLAIHEDTASSTTWSGDDGSPPLLSETESATVHSIAQETVPSIGTATATASWTNSERGCGLAYEITPA